MDKLQISLSGGRTSGYMLHHILEQNGGLPDNAVVCFQNTGREMPQTLDFVNEISHRWDVPIVWLEYSISDDNKNTFEIVNHNSASRNGEPFDRLIDKYGRLPSARIRFCTGILKIETGQKYFKSLGWKHWHNAIGIRADELRRATHKVEGRATPIYPLVEAGKTIQDVADFWAAQSFDLNLPIVNGKTIKGNCDFCFLKSEATLAMMAREHPELAQWWIDAEKRTGKRFERRRDMATFVDFVGKQQDWIFNNEAYLCQADGGECTG
jgi:3'-phosphoadenosine 5'-phosphosulfate sulfotransferase (PAPS reductase)/FAD synthetase